MDARKDARAATAGSILITRLAIRGADGVVADGGFRDAEGIGALDMPAYYTKPSAPTNLTLHEALEINVQSPAVTPPSSLATCWLAIKTASW